MTTTNSHKRLVLFDLDNTLLYGDSDFAWAQFLIEKGVLDRELYQAQNDVFMKAYENGSLDIQAFLEFQLKPLSRHARRELDAWHTDFMKTKILPMISQKARDLVASHSQADSLLAIITATNSFITAPIAAQLGVPNLIATVPEEINGEFTGNVIGIPCFREGKIQRLKAWLEKRDLNFANLESWFYSDSLNDLPLLKVVHRPVAVDPDATLRKHAQDKGWPIISLRD